MAVAATSWRSGLSSSKLSLGHRVKSGRRAFVRWGWGERHDSSPRCCAEVCFMWPLLLQVSSLVNCHVGAPVMPARSRAMTVPSLVGGLPAPQESLPLPCPPQAAADLPLSLHFLEWEHHVLLPSSPLPPSAGHSRDPPTLPHCPWPSLLSPGGARPGPRSARPLSVGARLFPVRGITRDPLYALLLMLSVQVKLVFALTHRWLRLFPKALEPVRTRDSTALNMLKYEEPSETTTK